jgi:2-C-methyl-D-erythritol 4-phosphate cytidylyltransferase
MHVAAIIAAGGRGQRLGGGTPKQWLDLDGRSILQCSIDAMDASALVDELILVLPGNREALPWRPGRKPCRVAPR